MAKYTGYVAVDAQNVAHVGTDKDVVENAAGTKAAPLSEQSMANADALLKYHADVVRHDDPDAVVPQAPKK
jgi:hypothetical protein